MAKASQAEEPSMEEILASIRRIISDEETPADAAEKPPAASLVESNDNPTETEAADDMADSTEMSQDDLDKLFDMDAMDDDGAGDEIDDMAAAMAADAADDDEDEDVLELSEDDASDDIEMVGGLAEDLDADDADIAFVEPEPVKPAPAKPRPAAPKASVATRPIPDDDLPDVGEDGALTSDATGHAVHAALDNLSHMFIGGNAQTIEELVRDMLRPMLKAWLDQNLPPMVEELVKKEIQRVTRRR